jgi:hypothetical protein
MTTIISAVFLSPYAGFRHTKKQRFFFLCFIQPAGGLLLSRNGPPSSWRAKIIIKVVIGLFLLAEHHIILLPSPSEKKHS